jgi:C4-dicarboxylate-specific signal transduction histidine kinase
MGLIFSMSAADRMKYFFALFFVLGLIAATYSLPGATLVAGLIQLLLFVLATHADVNSANLMDMQIVMLMLSLTGLIIGIEVDERLQTQERLRDSLQLVAAGELAGALAHELNQPMSALNAYAESALMLSQNRAVQPSRQTQLEQLLRNIANETVRASDIVKGLRSYFISGVSTLEPMHVQDWVNECVTRVTQNAAQSGVLISTYFEQSTDAFVGDRIQLSTALGNLLKNAIEASGPGMSIKVHVSDNKRALRIRVVDQGPLLGLDNIDRVFRPFYSDKKDGLGLGLSVSQSLVENNGGTLRYLVEPEKCFEILLPLGDSVGV